MTTVGSLFTGYGGLDMGIATALGQEARVAWTSDVEPGPCRLAEVRWPGVPNLGDITRVDWATVEPVDVICGGSPCQDLSFAGRRAGMRAGTRSGLWVAMAAAIETIRPRLVVWENVQGALTSGAYSLVERESGLLGDGAVGHALRAAGRVVGDLASLGYDCRWAVVRASDAGAPHQRARLFLVGHPHGQPWQLRGAAGPGETPSRRALRDPAGPSRRALIPTPTASDHKAGRHPEGTGRSLTQAVQLLPTPQAVNASYSSATYGPNLHEAVRNLLPIAAKLEATALMPTYGPYAAAIARWEQITGRDAPPPSTPSRRPGGKPQLSTRFVEWLMGLPEGHVTGSDLGLPREQQLRILGNGVVPQQAALAVGMLVRAAWTEEYS